MGISHPQNPQETFPPTFSSMIVTTPKNQQFEFFYHEKYQIWTANATAQRMKIEIHIIEEEYLQDHIDWGYVAKFLAELESSTINFKQLIPLSQKLLLALAETFDPNSSGNLSMDDYTLALNRIIFKGRSTSNFSDYYAYSMCFEILRKPDFFPLDVYGEYAIDVEGIHIVGARRIHF